MLLLEINQEPRTNNVVVAAHNAASKAAIANDAGDVVELKSGIRIPQPVQSQGDPTTDAAKNVLTVDGRIRVAVIEVGIRISSSHLPRSPAGARSTAATVNKEEVFEWFGAVERTGPAIPWHMLTGQEVRRVDVTSVYMDSAEPGISLHKQILVFPDFLS